MQWVCDRACGPGEASSRFYWDTMEAPLNGQEKLATEDKKGWSAHNVGVGGARRLPGMIMSMTSTEVPPGPRSLAASRASG